MSVAIGELADGLSIDLNKVTKKYEGLDGTELAISESQERMAVAVAAKDADAFIALANAENLEATVVATVTEEKRMREYWNGKAIVDLSREFLSSNGAERHAGRPHSARPRLAAPVGRQYLCGKDGVAGHRPERPAARRAWASGSTPPSARPPC